MSRELPLLIGTIGAVLGSLALFPGLSTVVVLAYYHPTGSNWDIPPVESSLSFVFAWAVSPGFGLAGAFTVKRHGKLGGVLFLTAGLLPWVSGLLVWPKDPLFILLWFFWTPLVILAGTLALLDWPGPYVDPEDKAEISDTNA